MRVRKDLLIVVTVTYLWGLSGGLRSHAQAADSGGSARVASELSQDGYRSDQYWIGRGQGDLSKGSAVCQRVAELAARADVAKQIRVLVKEHLVDRTRERTGKEIEQDIELTREEIVQEYLNDVQIIDRRIDEERKICVATAVMSKHQAPLNPGPATTPDIIPPRLR
ncbi:MAG: hypothetical protein FJ247_10695 [Nitrospira sp.]|nr:hypothetical protein [Nitrospira sp.]